MGLRVVGVKGWPKVEMTVEPSTPQERAATHDRFLRFELNVRRVRENYQGWRAEYPGWYVCVAAETPYFAATGRAAVLAAQAAHPEDADAVELQYLKPAGESRAV